MAQVNGDHGTYIVLGGRKLRLKKHATDFSVLADARAISAPGVEETRPLARHMTRARVGDRRRRDQAMREVRQDSVAHHIYEVEGTNEEVVIDDHIILELRDDSADVLQRLIDEYKLAYVSRMADAYVLRVTEATGRNPLKVANELAARDEVASCSPQLVVEMQLHRAELFPDQWYLTTDLISHPDVRAGSDVAAPEAWQITTGDPEVVVAVIDDGFDLGHPALSTARLHPDRADFEGDDPQPAPDGNDYHGTPVASIAVGGHDGSAMMGIAPGCTFLPVRIGFGPGARPIDILEVFRFVSERADVVNCSFGTPPRSFDPFPRAFRRAISQLCETGGRRGRGLVMVFSAANDDAPTFLEASRNVNGVRFTQGSRIAEVPAGNPVFSGYPMTPGVVVVGAMSSMKRKAGYSCWGPHLTVTAPSNNMHYITAFVPPGDPRRDAFLAHYRGLGQVAAVNRPGNGAPFDPIARFDNPATPNVRENLYTARFGGTSGAAPVVSGVAALMISANPHLSAAEVRQILESTADADLDPALDLAADPNVQGLDGGFVDGRSLFFGAGKVNAARAVARARALNPDEPAPPAPRSFRAERRPDLPIPDRRPEGVVSRIDCPVSGPLKQIAVSVDVEHSYRGDLRVLLVSPDGFVAELHGVDRRDGRDDLAATFTPDNSEGLERLVRGGVESAGVWTLNVSDNLFRDTGTLRAWSLDLTVD